MFDFIEKLSKKTEKQRRALAVLASLGVTLVIFGIWLSVILPTSFYKNGGDNGSGTVASSVATKASPVNAFKRDMAAAYTSLKGQLGFIREKVKISPSVYTATSSVSVSTESASTTQQNQ